MKKDYEEAHFSDEDKVKLQRIRAMNPERSYPPPQPLTNEFSVEVNRLSDAIVTSFTNLESKYRNNSEVKSRYIDLNNMVLKNHVSHSRAWALLEEMNKEYQTQPEKLQQTPLLTRLKVAFKGLFPATPETPRL